MELSKEIIEKCKDADKLGDMLRHAAWDGKVSLVKLIVEKGIANINYNGNDRVFVCNPTPLHCAVEGGNIDIVKYLLEQRADVSIADRWGYRAFHEAKAKDEKKILELINECEPKEWHQRECCIERLKKLELPDEVIEFLGSENRRIDLKESEWTNYVEFYALDEVRTFKWRVMTFVDLIWKVDNYDNIGVISWIPEHKSFACLDIEHEMFGFIKEMTWSGFLKSPAKFIDGSLSWEFCEDNEDE